MADTKRTWISILIAGIVIVIMLAAAAIGTTALFFYRHVNSAIVPADAASAELAGIRSRFSGQQPMIEIVSDAVVGADREPYAGLRAVVHRERVAAGDIHMLHVLAYDTRINKLVRADIPRWLLELSSAGGRIRIANLDVMPGSGDRVTLEDFDRRGPGLIMNARRLRGTELVVWTD